MEHLRRHNVPFAVEPFDMPTCREPSSRIRTATDSASISETAKQDDFRPNFGLGGMSSDSRAGSAGATGQPVELADRLVLSGQVATIRRHALEAGRQPWGDVTANKKTVER